MNRNIRKLGAVIIGLYLILFVKLNWIQVVQKQSLDTNPLNTAQVRRDYNRPRGSISSADGALLAQSIANPDPNSEFDRIRVYPEGDLFGQITGYFSFTFGSSAVERQYNDELAGTTFDQQVSGFSDLFVARENVGNVSVTVRKDVQQVARDALGDRAGSVVALDPRSGDLLALWSWPSYDPNAISTLDSKAANENWRQLNSAPGNPLRSHQFQDRYFPGSTFKVVTGGIGLQTGRVTDVDPSYPFASSYTAKNTTLPIKNFGGEVCGGTLPEILKTSCNSAFAEMGAETIGADDMVAGVADWGFNSTPPIDLPGAVRSVFPTDVAKNAAKLAQSSIGQNDVQASPLQMALVAAGVANGGTIMKPHVLAEVRNSQGEIVKSYPPTPWLHPMTDVFAATMRQDMLRVVQNGTAVGMQIPGFDVGGKTGTAQLGTTPPRSHTWIMGFAGPPGQPPTVAIAVVVLDQSGANESTGGVVAAPIAKAVLTAALKAQGFIS